MDGTQTGGPCGPPVLHGGMDSGKRVSDRVPTDPCPPQRILGPRGPEVSRPPRRPARLGGRHALHLHHPPPLPVP